MEDHFAVIDRGGNTYELAQKSFSKATACEYMVQKFGADKEDVYVFGDSMNDLSMFEYAVHTVAWENMRRGLPLHGICDKDRGRGRDRMGDEALC